MANPQNCYQSVQVCRLRAARLDVDGSVIGGADSQYIGDAPIDVGVNPVVVAGDRFELKNGCGSVCVDFQDCDRVTSVDLSMTLCNLDFKLIEMLTGATLLVSAGRTVGLQLPEADAACPNGASFEFWTKAWDITQQASSGGLPLYHKWAIPKTTWTLGQFTVQHGTLSVPLTGRGRPNALFYDGPGNDWPASITAALAVMETTTVPTATCEYSTIVGS